MDAFALVVKLVYRGISYDIYSHSLCNLILQHMLYVLFHSDPMPL